MKTNPDAIRQKTRFSYHPERLSQGKWMRVNIHSSPIPPEFTSSIHVEKVGTRLASHIQEADARAICVLPDLLALAWKWVEHRYSAGVQIKNEVIIYNWNVKEFKEQIEYKLLTRAGLLDEKEVP